MPLPGSTRPTTQSRSTAFSSTTEPVLTATGRTLTELGEDEDHKEYEVA